jgi:hypothetical protein
MLNLYLKYLSNSLLLVCLLSIILFHNCFSDPSCSSFHLNKSHGQSHGQRGTSGDGQHSLHIIIQLNVLELAV